MDAPYVIGRVVCVVDKNKLSLLVLHIWLVGSFMLWTTTNSVYICLIAMVVHVTNNNKLSLLMLYSWLVG